MLNFLTVIFYLASAAIQAITLKKERNIANLLSICFALIAVLLHSYLLYHWIDLTSGQNLTEFNLLSLATWLIAIIILIMKIKQPVAYLETLTFPLAGGSVFLAAYFPSSHILQTAQHPEQFLHIILSVLTFSVLSIAGIQAVTLAVQEKILKQKLFEISPSLPPIETMEKILFQTILVGVILLSCLLGTSIYFFHEILFDQFLQKAVLTFIAWFIFTLLLVGRHYFGWRGKKAIYCTLGGVFLLSTIYFGSMLIAGFWP